MYSSPFSLALVPVASLSPSLVSSTFSSPSSDEIFNKLVTWAPRSELAADVINRQWNFTLYLLFAPLASIHGTPFSLSFLLPSWPSLSHTYQRVLQLFYVVSRSYKSLSAKFRDLTSSPISRKWECTFFLIKNILDSLILSVCCRLINLKI